MICQVIVELNLKDGSYEDLRKLLVDALPETRSYDGNIDISCVHDQDDPNRVIIIERFESRQHYESYLAFRMESGTFNALLELLTAEPVFTFADPMGV